MVNIKALSRDATTLTRVVVPLSDSSLDGSPMRPIVFDRRNAALPVGVVRALHLLGLHLCLALARAILAVSKSYLCSADQVRLLANRARLLHDTLRSLVRAPALRAAEVVLAVLPSTRGALVALPAGFTDQGYLGTGPISQSDRVGLVSTLAGAILMGMRAFAGLEFSPADRAALGDGVALGTHLADGFSQAATGAEPRPSRIAREFAGLEFFAAPFARFRDYCHDTQL